jgi:hypothetical protein
MATDIVFEILDERGREILDELEGRTSELPYLLSEFRRLYYLGAEDAEASGFDVALDEIDRGWREHLARTA